MTIDGIWIGDWIYDHLYTTYCYKYYVTVDNLHTLKTTIAHANISQSAVFSSRYLEVTSNTEFPLIPGSQITTVSQLVMP
jgi:hypothetical protein